MGSLDIVFPLCMKINVCHDTLRTGRGPSACRRCPERLDHKAIFRKIIGERSNLASPLAEDHESSCRQYALSSIRIPGTALVNALHERPESPKPGPLSTLVALPPRNSDDSLTKRISPAICSGSRSSPLPC